MAQDMAENYSYYSLTGAYEIELSICAKIGDLEPRNGLRNSVDFRANYIKVVIDKLIQC